MFSLLYCTISITIANGDVVDIDVKDRGFIHSDTYSIFQYCFFDFVSTLLFVFLISALIKVNCLIYSPRFLLSFISSTAPRDR